MSFPSNSKKEMQEKQYSGPGIFLSGLMWCLVIIMLVIFSWAVTQRTGFTLASARGSSLLLENSLGLTAQDASLEAPEFQPRSDLSSLSRQASLHTVIPERIRENISTYEVQAGDSVFTIAKEFKIEPETVLWANSEILDDNPNMLSVGQELKIPAVDGVIYKWKSTDTIEGVANKLKADPDADLNLARQ